MSQRVHQPASRTGVQQSPSGLASRPFEAAPDVESEPPSQLRTRPFASAPASAPSSPPAAQAAPGGGLPEGLRAGIEALSGHDLGDVRVHYGSPAPARLDALAYAQGRDIHLGPGQESALPHEAWHVVQQAERRVPATRRLSGAAINDNPSLEREAETMGVRALQRSTTVRPPSRRRDVAAPEASLAQLLRKPTTEERQTLEQMLVEINQRLDALRPQLMRLGEQQIATELAQINELGDQAINYAVQVFEIDVSKASSLRSKIGRSGPFLSLVSETSTFGSIAAGTTDRHGNVAIGPSAFSSAANLGSTIGHEATVHAAHHTGSNWSTDKTISAQQEVEAHGWELQHAKTFGLSQSEIEGTQSALTDYQKTAQMGAKKTSSSDWKIEVPSRNSKESHVVDLSAHDFQAAKSTVADAKKEVAKQSSSWCFVTTACVEARGLPLDCAELTVLRAFRDGYLTQRPGGAALIAEYEAVAPSMVAALHAHPEGAAILDGLYTEISVCVDLIRRREEEEALARYVAAMLGLRDLLGS